MKSIIILILTMAALLIFASGCSRENTSALAAQNAQVSGAGEENYDNRGNIVSYNGMTYFIAGHWYDNKPIFRVSQEKGAIPEEIYRPRNGDVCGLAVTGNLLYWIEGDWGHELWLMRSDDGFASTERVADVGNYPNFYGIDGDAVYIDSGYTGEPGHIAESRLNRITHDGKVSYIKRDDSLDEVCFVEAYQGYTYYTKDDPVLSSDEEQVWFSRGLFRKPSGEMFKPGGFEGAVEELVTEDFVLVDDPGDGDKVTVDFLRGTVYFATGGIYEDWDEINIKEVDLTTFATNSVAIGAPWNVRYAASGDGAVYYLDWKGGTVNRASFGGVTEQLAMIPQIEIYISTIVAIGPWLYVSDIYSDRCLRVALDGSGAWETVYPASQPAAFSGDGHGTTADEGL
jgi:hypothetical protein